MKKFLNQDLVFSQLDKFFRLVTLKAVFRPTERATTFPAITIVMKPLKAQIYQDPSQHAFSLLEKNQLKPVNIFLIYFIILT